MTLGFLRGGFCAMLREVWVKRREARERAVQFLFQHDLNPPEKLDEALAQFWQFPDCGKPSPRKKPPPPGGRIFRHSPPPSYGRGRHAPLRRDNSIRGAIGVPRPEVDRKSSRTTRRTGNCTASPPWTGISCAWPSTKMLHREDIPPVVSINEAVEIAKKFSTGQRQVRQRYSR